MPLVFLHGWGQSQQIWYAQKKHFHDAFFINLAGHGGRDDTDGDSHSNIELSVTVHP